VRYYERSAAHGYPDGANNLGFCLEYGRGTRVDLEAAARCYKFARDHGHPEGQINYNRCLRIQGRWKTPDRSCSVSDRSSADTEWPSLFTAYLEDPGAADGASDELMASIRQLKAEMSEPPDRPIVKLVKKEKRSFGFFSVSSAPVHRQVICEGLDHPLIASVSGGTEAVPNGSLASHLPGAFGAELCQLRGHTRIAKIVAGIVLAMQFVHSRGIVHRRLSPDSVLLDWDWSVKIGDCSLCIPIGHDPPVDEIWNSLLWNYLAPEGYRNEFVFGSDVFSFGLILWQILTGRPPFSNLNPFAIAKKICVDETRPRIPEFVLPAVRELICDCWAPNPDDRPSFREILERLKAMRFKVTPGVNSAKVAAFVQKISNWERENGLD
jgi:serine/threonine protein kinase